MASVPDDLLYTPEHEWVRVDGSTVTIGVTDFAQGELGDVVYVELPEVGSSYDQMEPFGTVESVKSVSDLFAPVSGEVIAVNEDLEAAPEAVNEAPFEEGWLIRMEINDLSQLERLLDASDYSTLIADQA
jgi:glycine cleavage system H protein